MLQESIRALILTPLITISELYFGRADDKLKSTVTKVVHMTAVVLLPIWLLAGLDLQTMAKYPFF